MNSMAEQLTSRIEAIRSHRRQLETILSSMNEGVVLVDSLFRLKSMNPAAQDLFNVTTLTTRAGEPRALLEAIRNSELFNLVRRAHQEDSTRETSIVVYLSRPRYMHLSATPVEVENEPHVLVVLNDITRLKELERIRRDFVANVSHELKTPITSILGFVETLSDGAIEDREEAHRFLDIIASQSQRLNAIIEDLLQLSRLEQNQGEIHRESVSAHEIIDAVRSNVAFRAAERDILIRDEYQGRPTVLVAPGLVQQALTNLTDNAIKYCPPGSTVVLRVQRNSTEVVFSVADNGPGIPLVDQPRLFERFFRVDKARSRALGGTGLGLAIVKHIAQAHGGSVTVDSFPGRGSTFHLHLPQETITPGQERGEGFAGRR
jgi:two-component system phosphate regulon sensor histidine kinase PhoR